MPDTNTPNEQTGELMEPQLSGVDLARVALHAAHPHYDRATGRARAHGFTAVLQGLMADQAWELPAAGGALRDRWAAIAPDLAGHVAAVGYDPGSGRLTVCPELTAWATKARLEQTRVIPADEVRFVRDLTVDGTGRPADR
ncbi:DciA family protein [Streptomyces sp. NPDC052236]|uniref:DciA family protein n=1 Tax=Streptomyces sp. NPDC052236 TaxID=3365686 RepID=UPI0037D7566D